MKNFRELITDRLGNVRAGVAVEIRRAGTATRAALFATNNTGGATLSNPLNTDNDGFVSGYVADGIYDFVVEPGAIDSRTYPNIEIYDLGGLRGAIAADVQATLAAQAQSVVDTAVANALVVVNAQVQLARDAAATAAADVRTILGTPIGSAGLGFQQSGTGSTPSTVEAQLRKFVRPEQFGAISGSVSNVQRTINTAALQAAIDEAGNWPSAGRANDVLFTDFIETNGPVLLRPYVSLRGIGGGRSGIRPSISSGPAIDCDSVINTSGLFHQTMSGFRIDGVNATGSAYALRIAGQQHGRLDMVEFWNWATSAFPVQITRASYGIVFDQCNWHNNNQHLSIIGATGGLLPTTIRFTNCCIFEQTPVQTNEAILIQDASGVTFDGDTLFQSNQNLYTVRFKSTVIITTTAEHRISGCYVEDNGGAQANSYFAYFDGDATNKLDKCIVENLKCHQSVANKPTSQIGLKNTTRFMARDNSEGFGGTFLKDLGGNTGAMVSPRNVGTCELQDISTPVAVGLATAVDVLTQAQGVTSVAKQAVGRYRVTLAQAMSGTDYIVMANAIPASGIAITQQYNIISATQFDLLFHTPNGAAVAPYVNAVDPGLYSFSVFGKQA